MKEYVKFTVAFSDRAKSKYRYPSGVALLEWLRWMVRGCVGGELGVGIAVRRGALGRCVEEEVLGAAGDHTHALLPAVDACDVATRRARPRAGNADDEKDESSDREHRSRRDQERHRTPLPGAAVIAAVVAVAATATAPVVVPHAGVSARVEGPSTKAHMGASVSLARSVQGAQKQFREQREIERKKNKTNDGGGVRLSLGLRERERGILQLTLPKTVSSQHDHSVKECHPKWVSQPQIAGKDSA